MKTWREQAVEVGCQILECNPRDSKLGILARRNDRIVKKLSEEEGVDGLLAVMREILIRHPEQKPELRKTLQKQGILHLYESVFNG